MTDILDLSIRLALPLASQAVGKKKYDYITKDGKIMPIDGWVTDQYVTYRNNSKVILTDHDYMYVVYSAFERRPVKNEIIKDGSKKYKVLKVRVSGHYYILSLDELKESEVNLDELF